MQKIAVFLDYANIEAAARSSGFSVDYGELLDYLAREPLDVLVTFGAGDVDRFIGPITELLGKRLA